jgi:hypothetical protein
MINFIQINTGTCRESHSILYASMAQHSAGILLIQEDTSKIAAIINPSKSDNWFVWVKIRNISYLRATKCTVSVTYVYIYTYQ